MENNILQNNFSFFSLTTATSLHSRDILTNIVIFNKKQKMKFNWISVKRKDYLILACLRALSDIDCILIYSTFIWNYITLYFFS